MTGGIRAWWVCASTLLAFACLEPNPNAVDTSTSDTTGTDETGTSEAGTSEAGTTDTTGTPACVDIVDPDECAAAEGCQPVEGSKLKEHGAGSPCLEPAQFLGCIPEQVCDPVLTWFCLGNGSYQVGDTCGPEGFAACDGPVDPVDACP